MSRLSKARLLSTIGQDSLFKSINLCNLRSILYVDFEERRFVVRNKDNTWFIRWSGNNTDRYIKIYRRPIFFLPIARCILHYRYSFTNSVERVYIIKEVCRIGVDINNITSIIDSICKALEVQIAKANSEEEHILEVIHQVPNIDTEEHQSANISRLENIELRTEE